MRDGGVKVAFESGEVHRYKPASLHKMTRSETARKSKRRMSACYGWNEDSEHSRDGPGRRQEATGDATMRCSGLQAELRKVANTSKLTASGTASGSRGPGLPAQEVATPPGESERAVRV